MLRLNEQTALEPSQLPAAAALSGAWLGYASAYLQPGAVKPGKVGKLGSLSTSPRGTSSSMSGAADAEADAAVAAALAQTAAAATAARVGGGSLFTATVREGDERPAELSYGAAFLEGHLKTHACGACLEPREGSGLGGAACKCRDSLSKHAWRPSTKPGKPEELSAWKKREEPPWAAGMRALRRLRRGPRSFSMATQCETYAVLRCVATSPPPDLA